MGVSGLTTSTPLVAAFAEGRIPLARQTEHFSYSEVTVKRYPAMQALVIGQTEPGAFAAIGSIINQIDALDAFAAAAGVERLEDTPPYWFYRNRAEQPPDPGGNPVREPFLFEIGFPIVPLAESVREPAPGGGEFRTCGLEEMSVASVIYRGSFPHQPNSGFVEAWMTLVHQAEPLGYRPSGRLYQELYHLMDWGDPAGSISEIHTELE